MDTKQNFQEISLDQLVPFANHPFKLYEGQRFTDMVESVRENGVLTPIIVRPIADGKYEILSGHNRVAAAREAGLESVPAIVREGLNDDEAMFIVTETNLIQRSFNDMKHSEKAVVIAVHYDSIKKKSGYRTDLLEDVATLSQVATRSTRGKIGEQYGLSKDTINRYLRINKLIPMLKEKIDNDNIGIVAAVSLSYLRENEQELLNDILGESGNVGTRQADRLRKESENRELSREDIEQILNPEKQEKVKPFKVKSEIIEKYFKGKDDAEIESEIETILSTVLEHCKGKNADEIKNEIMQKFGLIPTQRKDYTHYKPNKK